MYICIYIYIYIYIYMYIYMIFQINDKSSFTPVKDDREQTIALHNCKYICKIKAKTTKILKCIKTLLKVYT